MTAPDKPTAEKVVAGLQQLEQHSTLWPGERATCAQAATLITDQGKEIERLKAEVNDANIDAALELAAMQRADAARLTAKRALEEMTKERDGWRQQYFDSLAVVDKVEDRARDAAELLASRSDDTPPSTEVLRAAWCLCEDTEGTVFADEFGEHYRVPKDSWDRLSRAVASAAEGGGNELVS